MWIQNHSGIFLSHRFGLLSWFLFHDLQNILSHLNGYSKAALCNLHNVVSRKKQHFSSKSAQQTFSHWMLLKAKCNLVASLAIKMLETYNFPDVSSTTNCSMTGSFEINEACVGADRKMLKDFSKKQSSNKMPVQGILELFIMVSGNRCSMFTFYTQEIKDIESLGLLEMFILLCFCSSHSELSLKSHHLIETGIIEVSI